MRNQVRKGERTTSGFDKMKVTEDPEGISVEQCESKLIWNEL